MKRLMLATALVLPAATAGAGELAPMAGLHHSFRGGASALIYFTPETDGYHVVATVQTDNSEAMKIFRFTAILAAGQSAEVSVPHEAGTAADVIVIKRTGDNLSVEDGVIVANAGQ